MAIVGTQLLLPEAGWKRYDEKSLFINFSSGFYSIYRASYNEWLCAWAQTSKANETMKFKFFGNSIRILNITESNHGSATIDIDGNKESFSCYTPSMKVLNLVYEKLNLENKIHEVTITTNTSGLYYCFDAVDINSDGYFIHDSLHNNTIITSMSIGEYIPVDFSYEKGFFNFNNGSTLNFICVENSKKRAVLVSDTVIPNISFDEINQKGFIYGNEISHPFGDKIVLNVRSMTNAEYDKYIVNSTLNGLIATDDKNIWNWDISTITSSSPTDASKITTIGGTSISTITQTLTQTSKAATYGFRPILIIDKSRLSPTFTNSTQFGLHGSILNINIANILINNGIYEDNEMYDITIKDVGNNILYTENKSVIDNTFIYAIEKEKIPNLQEGIPTSISIEILDSQELIEMSYINIILINNELYVFDSLYSSSVSNTNLKDSVIIDLDISNNSISFVKIDSMQYININNLEKININKQDIKIVTMLDKDAVINSFAAAFVN